jgi:hypothetical protein
MEPDQFSVPQHVTTLHLPAENSLEKYNTRDPAVARWISGVLQAVQDAKTPVLVHCRSGKDRTGVIAAAILHCGGLSDPDVMREFSLSEGTDPALLQLSLDGFRAKNRRWLRGVNVERLVANFFKPALDSSDEVQYLSRRIQCLSALANDIAAAGAGDEANAHRKRAKICIVLAGMCQHKLSIAEPPKPALWMRLGWAHQCRGQFSDAAAAYEKAQECLGGEEGRRQQALDRHKKQCIHMILPDFGVKPKEQPHSQPMQLPNSQEQPLVPVELKRQLSDEARGLFQAGMAGGDLAATGAYHQEERQPALGGRYAPSWHKDMRANGRGKSKSTSHRNKQLMSQSPLEVFKETLKIMRAGHYQATTSQATSSTSSVMAGQKEGAAAEGAVEGLGCVTEVQVKLDRRRLQQAPTRGRVYECTTTSLPRSRGVRFPSIIVVEQTTLAAAQALITAHSCANPAVLNFASDSNPGGGVRKGNQSGTQEETICRCTSLLPSLEALQYPLDHSAAAYTPDIEVIRADGPTVTSSSPVTPTSSSLTSNRTSASMIDDGPLQQCQQLEQYQLLPVPFRIGVVSAALRSASWPQDRAFVEAKVRGVMQIAEANNHRAIVLGAWGCGAFGNPTAEVAGCFARVLAEGTGRLERVVFAIPDATKARCFREHLQESGVSTGAGERTGRSAK